jgi:hypothetical protein
VQLGEFVSDVLINKSKIMAMRSSDVLTFQARRAVVDAMVQDLRAKGAIKSAEAERMPVEEASNHHPWAGLIWGGNFEIGETYGTGAYSNVV